MGVRVTRDGVHFDRRHAGRTVQVVVDDHRLWTLALEGRDGTRTVTWPYGVRERLTGSSECQIESENGDRLWKGRVVWDRGSSDSRPDFTDREGRPLVVSKWGVLRPSFTGFRDPGIREQVVRSAAELIRELESMGLPAFVVGGTLLGARRDGRLLTHDDDADVAYLSAHEHPSDLVTEAHAIEQRLRARGYTLLRHSWSHLQVFFGDPSGEEYYVDIFTAFYKNGYFHEPIHVRARGLDKKIVPVSRLTLHGVDVPAPRNPDAWLVACYGPGWRTPDPAFRFDTPLPTRRRFDGWFSSFDMRREFWESTLQGTGSGQETTLIRDHVIVAAEGTRAVIDLGAGLGADAVFYRDAGLACFASDYAVKPHNSAAPVNAGVEHINLANYTDTASYLLSAFDVVGGASGCVVSANHVLATLDGPTRRTAYELLRLALRGGAQVLVSDYAELGDYRFEDPRTWHLDETTLLRELSPLGLSATTLQMAHHVDRDGVRRPVHVSALVLDDSRTDDERSSTLA